MYVQANKKSSLLWWFTYEFVNDFWRSFVLPKHLTNEIFFLLLIALGSCDEGDACLAVGAPVCGSDGITYGNSCYAEAAGIENYTSGECAN